MDTLSRSLAQAGGRETVTLAEVIAEAHAPLHAALGHAPDGQPIGLDLAKLPHLAIAGASGSGKSTLIHTILASLLMVSDPDQLQLVMVDVTGELDEYRGLPHLVIDPIDEVEQGIQALEGLGGELERRYSLLQRYGVRDIGEYNRTAPEGRLPWVLCVVEEFASLMLGDDSKRVETAIAQLGIRGRKCGIHLILATQIPHAVVLTSKIKANMCGRIALTMPSAVFSRVAVDVSGAEKLHGHGDALLRDGMSVTLQRFQSAYVDRQTIRELVFYWHGQQLIIDAEREARALEDSHRLTMEPPRATPEWSRPTGRVVTYRPVDHAPKMTSRVIAR